MAMLCQCCEKARATVHLTDILASGEPVERHLCDACAAKEGVSVKQQATTLTIMQEFLKQGAGLKAITTHACPKCGVTFKEFHDQGLLGCPHDYTFFADILKPIIERAQDGATEHVGKCPKQAGETVRRRAMLLRLQRELDETVRAEAYEKAAKIRDQIQALEQS